MAAATFLVKRPVFDALFRDGRKDETPDRETAVRQFAGACSSAPRASEQREAPYRTPAVEGSPDQVRPDAGLKTEVRHYQDRQHAVRRFASAAEIAYQMSEDTFQVPTEAAEVQIRGKEQAFLVFSTLAGDVVRVAHALGIREADVERMATEGKWREKLKAILDLKNSADPATIERAINRAISFAQCHRWRLFLDRVISRFEDMPPAEFESYLLSDVYDPKTGQTKHVINGRPLADVSIAIEKCHSMIYQALSDTAQDRNRREEQEGGSSQASGDLHQKIALAMSQLVEVKSPGDLITEAQLASAAVLAERVKVTVTEPETPYNKGD